MQIALVGLGKMGGNMARRLMKGGHEVVVFDLDEARVAALAAEGARGVRDYDELVAAMTPPRTVWVMVPAGPVTEQVVRGLAEVLESGDAIVDGGNGFYGDDVRRARELASRGIDYLDAGTSGGVWGAERGYCLMVGGEASAFARIEPALRTLAPGEDAAPPTPERDRRGGTAEQGYLHCGPAGSGHFVKMVHNGIEYALMQAYAEGFDLLANAASDEVPSERRFDLDVAEIAELWRRGSVIGSWLLDLTASALAEDPHLAAYSGHVSDSGEGRWTVDAAVERAVPVPTIAASLFARFRSRQESTFADKTLSAMRAQFGGHREPK